MDILSLQIKHPVVGARELAIKAGEGGDVDLGGYSKERTMNGNGSSRPKMSRKGWKVSGISADTSNPEDHKYLQDVQNSPLDAEFVLAWVDGVVYRGTGSIDGDLSANRGEGYASITLTGGGVLRPIA